MRYFGCSLCGEIVANKFDLDMSGGRHIPHPPSACAGGGILHEVFLSLALSYPIIIQPGGERFYQLPTGDLIAVKLFDDALADFAKAYPALLREEQNDNLSAGNER